MKVLDTSRNGSVAVCLACAFSLALAAEIQKDDAAALALEPEISDAASTTTPAAGSTRLYVEGAVVHVNRRYSLGDGTIGRASVDYRTGFHVFESVRGNLSARLDSLSPSDSDVGNPVLSLREAYLTWQSPAAGRLVELGRVNMREGPGYGYNPTDFFRAYALRTVSTLDPVSLREMRLGTVMLRGQQLWTGGSIDAIYAPKLKTSRNLEGLSADLGATNSNNKVLLVLGSRPSETFSTRLLLYKEAGADPQVGFSLTALLSDGAVAHLEWSGGKEQTLLQRASSHAGTGTIRYGNRAAGGLTYTTASRLSLTAEYQYNGFALDRDGWKLLDQAPPEARSAYFWQALREQDSAARNAVLLYAVQRDLIVKNLELTALVKLNYVDRSRLAWLEIRYHLERADVALRLQDNTGEAGSEFGVVPIRNSVGLQLTYYF